MTFLTINLDRWSKTDIEIERLIMLEDHAGKSTEFLRSM